MEVVLLDSKCYPLTENESTSSESFWKSSRKILAANKSLYNKGEWPVNKCDEGQY